MRTAPRTPCAPTMMPTQMRLAAVAGASASAVRPSRRPLCGLLRMRSDFDAKTKIPHPEEARSAVSKDAGGFCTISAAGGRRGLGGFLSALLGLRLGCRFERRLADRRLADEPRIAEEAGDPFGRLGADPEPVLQALFLERHPIGMAALEHRVVGAELFDKAPVARAARVGDDDRVERPLLGAAAGEPDLQRHGLPLEDFRRIPGETRDPSIRRSNGRRNGSRLAPGMR